MVIRVKLDTIATVGEVVEKRIASRQVVNFAESRQSFSHVVFST